jgi:hypothetical protein
MTMQRGGEPPTQDQLGHSRVSMAQDVYVGRRSVDPSVAQALAVRPRRGPDARPSAGGATVSCLVSCSAFTPRLQRR